jgi:hypothetical protein
VSDDLERYQKLSTDMNLEGLRSLGHEMQPDGSISGIAPADLIGLSQAGARIACRWARLAGIHEAHFFRLMRDTWEKQCAEDASQGLRAEKAVLS